MSSIRTRLAATLLAAGGLLLAPGRGASRGAPSISIARVFDTGVPFADNVDAQIFFVARLPRVLVAALVGGALAAAGVVFQALFRNPLASPDTLGVSSGAALGAVAAISLGLDVSLGRDRGAAGQPGRLGRRPGDRLHARHRQAPGPLHHGAAASGRDDDRVFLGDHHVHAIPGRFYGHVPHGALADGHTRRRQLRAYPGGAAAAGGGIRAARHVATRPGSPEPRSGCGFGPRGGRRHVERVALVSASLATGAAVSLGGPVGFVGIVVPHMVRLVVGSDHRLVLPASALFGATFLIACDLAARTLFSHPPKSPSAS